ncbi:MAG: D-alanine--D-alanine ligase [Flavobacteriaceae bacterium]|nr:D-alanine--D-alanine ligase [Flavobacteriaceae bacterium]
MIRVGIFFGGVSREREVSFAGGRTVYDNLDKSLFEAIPIFVDPWGNLCLLDWQYVYKGSIRDFYPPVSALPVSKHDFQVYAESLGEISRKQQRDLLKSVGNPINIDELKDLLDLAFLALHGNMAEDGTIQGILEWLGIPYTGCGILPSAIGIQKTVQKEWQGLSGFATPAWQRIKRNEWLQLDEARRQKLFIEVKKKINLPLVIKSASQGSSIGVNVLKESEFSEFERLVNRSFFIEKLTKENWLACDKEEFIRNAADIRHGIGLPLMVDTIVVHHPEDLWRVLDKKFRTAETATLFAQQKENDVLLEAFIDGREFSCIVLQNEDGNPIALPPTEIVKTSGVYDYRSKYLPGLSRKITPIDLPEKKVTEIRNECQRLFSAFRCNVYARIDGFVGKDGKVFLNDPNTTSGMMPSSFFFHQAAEIGLNPSQFLTFIIRTSLAQRAETLSDSSKATRMLRLLEHLIQKKNETADTRINVAVVMGGYSSERHISVESGRNIYEKLSSSPKYNPIPVFLTGNNDKWELYTIPVNIMLKDNADDIKEKIEKYKENLVLQHIQKQCSHITQKYAPSQLNQKPKQLSVDELPNICSAVFIALHGRPGEDGTFQKELERLGLPYNGSGPESSAVTINKFETNNILREQAFPVADSMLLEKVEWQNDEQLNMQLVHARLSYPLIAKPTDDGCSSAVKRIENDEQLKAFAKCVFRKQEAIPQKQADILGLKPNEEFPRKENFLIEKLIDRGGALHFLEITGGLLTRYDQDGKLKYELFEPSEALAEGAVLSLEEKFLAGQGQNITPPRYSKKVADQKRISKLVKADLKKAAKLLKVEGYARIDAFVKIFADGSVETNVIEVNSLPGMTPATAIFHQCALNGYKPYEFIDAILEFGKAKTERAEEVI